MLVSSIAMSERLEELLRTAFPGAAELAVIDRTGGGDHFHVTVVERPGAAAPGRDHPRAANHNEGSGMSDLRARIKETIEQEPVVAFVKGTHEQAYCGNSDRAMQALRSVGAGFTTVDVLPDPSIRQELSALSNWPTIPQVFVAGELVGGADIVEELAVTGQLEATLDEKLGESWRRPGDERTVEVLEAGGSSGGLRLAPPA